MRAVESLPATSAAAWKVSAPLGKRLANAARPYPFIVPKLVFFAGFMLIPLAWTVYMTFQGGAILQGTHFVGTKNYQVMLQDPLFWLSLRNSVLYAVLVIPLAMAGGVFLATLLNRRIKLRPVFLLILVVPAVVSTVAAAYIWSNMLATDGGFFNTLLQALGRHPVNWLGTPSLLIPIFVALELWRGTGFYAMLFLAAMHNIPQELYDAIAIDGAGSFQSFRLVTLPLMRPVILFATVMATIWNLQIFDSPYVMTRGGPGYASMTIVMYIYYNAFKYDAMGLASAMSLVLLLLILAAAALQLTIFKKEVQF